MPDPVVRPYDHADRSAVHRIAAATAFFGEPVEAFMDDRDLFCDLFMTYYTDCEPELAQVACVGDEVVGYIVGSANTRGQRNRWRRDVLPGVARNALLGRYRTGMPTLLYAARSTRARLLRDIPPVALDRYPAHLHINLDAGQRGLGLGTRLMESFLHELRARGVPGVHLRTTDRNEAACRLYERTGFELLASRQTCVWRHVILGPVANLCYGLRLR